jgi:hypothetical protein
MQQLRQDVNFAVFQEDLDRGEHSPRAVHQKFRGKRALE